jgi:hypothetical protein
MSFGRNNGPISGGESGVCVRLLMRRFSLLSEVWVEWTYLQWPALVDRRQNWDQTLLVQALARRTATVVRTGAFAQAACPTDWERVAPVVCGPSDSRTGRTRSSSADARSDSTLDERPSRRVRGSMAT